MLKRLFWIVTLSLLLAGPVSRGMGADSHDTSHSTAQPSGGGSHGDAGGHEAKPDLLSLNFFNALWVVIIFLVLLAILYPTAWKNVLAGLKAREERIRNDIAEAEAARARAEATLREYNAQLSAAEDRVRQMINSATADGEKVAAQIRARGEHEAQEAKDRAVREIEAAQKQAIAEIYEQAASLATSVAEKILRRNLNADDQRDLVASSLEQLKDVSKN